MRIKSLDLKAFGPFTENKVEFSASPGTIDLIQGLNEAGKTSLLHAVSDLLFGIPHNTADAFLHPMRSMKIGAEIEKADGKCIILYRRKGNQNTLLDASDGSVDETVLRTFLGDIDRRTFEMMFGLDHDRLRAGGLEILAGRGEAGVSLLQAGAGIAGLRKVLAELENEADALFRPKGSNQVINAGLSRLRNLRDQTKEDSLSSECWGELTRDRIEVEAKLNEATGRLCEFQRERAMLDRVRRIMPLVARRIELVAELEGLRDAPDLRESARDERVEALRKIALAEQRRDRAREEVSKLSHELGEVCIDETFLDLSDEIEEVAGERALMQKNAQDLAKRETEEREYMRQIGAILQAAGLDVPIDNADELIPPKPAVAAIRALVKGHTTLSARRAAAQDEVKKLDARLAHDRAVLAAGTVPPDPSDLEAAVTEVAKAGPLERNLAELGSRQERERSTFDRMLSALGLFLGSGSDLEALTVPPAAAIERFATAFGKQSEKLAGTARKIEELDDEIRRREGSLNALRRGGQIATEDDLIESRRRRDSGWRLIRRAYIDSHHDVSAEAASFVQGMPLPDAYQNAVSVTDRVADVLRTASTRAAQIVTVEQDLESDRAARVQEVGKLAKVEADGSGLVTQWRGLWEPAGISPLEPAEMAEWLRRRADLLARSTSVGEIEDSIRAIGDEIARCHRRLIVAVRAVGDAAARNDETLAALLARAETVLKRLSKAHTERTALQSSVRAAEADLDSRKGELKTAAENLEQWRDEWANALTILQRDADTSPAAIETLLGEFESLREALNRLAAVRRQISGIKSDLSRDSAHVADLVSVAAPEYAGLDVPEAVRRMAVTLGEARKAVERRDNLVKLIETAHDDEGKAERALGDERTILGRLLQEARCNSAEELAVAEKRAARKRVLGEGLEDAEGQMLESGDGKSLAELVAEAEGRKLEDVVGRVSEIDSALQTLNQDSTELGARRATLSSKVDSLNRGGASAAHVAQEAELEAASVASGAARYTRLKLAGALLASAIDHYRKRNQGPLLARASEIFRRITAGSFGALQVEVDERDVPVVVGVRASGATVTVQGMSNGTRDQLFLALRVAAIEQYIAAKGPIPFIADDLLVDFDDERAVAALEVLSELSQRTQVLFFSHHKHIVEMAEKFLGATKVRIHELVRPPSFVADSAASLRTSRSNEHDSELTSES